MTVHYLARLVPPIKTAGLANLEREFERAIRTAKQLGTDLGFAPRVQWGLAFVDWWGEDRAFYEPNDDAPTAAVIVPVVEQRDLIDLAAVDLRTQHVARRLGDGHGFGLDALETARFGCCDLHLTGRPLDWLRFPLCSSIAGRVR